MKKAKLIYTKKLLEKILTEVIKNEYYIKSAGIVRSLDEAAIICFLNKSPETYNTEIIREAINDLKIHGHFNYSEEI